VNDKVGLLSVEIPEETLRMGGDRYDGGVALAAEKMAAFETREVQEQGGNEEDGKSTPQGLEG
jgi:hypothetical protein